VAILEIHGDHDEVVPYAGGHLFGRVDLPISPNVEGALTRWSRVNQCKGELGFRTAIDFISAIKGAETRVATYDRCLGAPIQLWSVAGGRHWLGLDLHSLEVIWSFLSGPTVGH
jgi:poly(3-hydroxybutyrate) depolymerase